MSNTIILKNIVSHLASAHMKVAVAESCTGGLLAAALTQLPGSSQWFDRGLITYSNQAKQELLGVTEKTLDLYGAVSEQTACAMAEGTLKNSPAHIALAITGIAGPEGGGPEKPVGTVWFALAHKNAMTMAHLQQFLGSRDTIRKKAVTFALSLLNKWFEDR